VRGTREIAKAGRADPRRQILVLDTMSTATRTASDDSLAGKHQR